MYPYSHHNIVLLNTLVDRSENSGALWAIIQAIHQKNNYDYQTMTKSVYGILGRMKSSTARKLSEQRIDTVSSTKHSRRIFYKSSH